MSFKIRDSGLRKISAPVVCEFDGVRKEFANGAILAETAFDKSYEVDEIAVSDGKVLVRLKETDIGSIDEPVNWIGEEAICRAPHYDRNEEWVKRHIEQFGEEPSLF